MARAPSLETLCVKSLKLQLLGGDDDDLLPFIYELPPHLFDVLVTQLPPFALQKLQTNMPFKCWDDYELIDDCLKNGRKRGRNDKFHRAWKALFKLRWPEDADGIQSCDWQQVYWETHLQNCLDEAAEVALLPSFDGTFGDIKISDDILRCIYHEEHLLYQRLYSSKLSYHCQEFGSYARSVRLLNVLCVAETCELLSSSKLQRIVLRWIRSEEHVDPLCNILVQNRDTLTSLEFIHCKLSSRFVNMVCSSLYENVTHVHHIQHFSVKTSKFEADLVSSSSGFLSFLKSGRSLSSLKFSDTHLDKNFARMVFTTLLDSCSDVSILDLSDNNISGWLSTSNRSLSNGLLSSEKSLRSLRSLNLRGNNLRMGDMENLRHALVHLPNLEILNLSDNAIEADGIRRLIPYFAEKSMRFSSLASLNLENCELSSDEVIELLDTLSTMKSPLKSLSLADNVLGSQVAEALGNFLASPIESLDISGICLGTFGFLELREKLVDELKLVNIDISKNRGGLEAAKFLSKLISVARKLVSINASYNLMRVDSLTILCSSLKAAKGSIERIDLAGYIWEHQPSHSSLAAEFQHNGKPIFLLPSQSSHVNVPYDDEP